MSWCPSAPSSSKDDILLSVLALPAQTGMDGFNEPYSKDNDYSNEEETLEDLEGESSQSSDITADEKRESGQTKSVAAQDSKNPISLTSCLSLFQDLCPVYSSALSVHSLTA